VGFSDDGERVALERADALATAFYGSLQDLASFAERVGKDRVAILCYRHLVRDILNEARSRAYHHAVGYLRKLEAIDMRPVDYGTLGDHGTFVGELRKRHRLKYGFWNKVEGKRA
jgi:hypothetical protein